MFIGLARAGVEVELLCEPSASAFSTYRDAGVPVEPLPIRRLYDRAAIRGIRSRLRAGNFDVLHLLTRRAVRNGLVAARGTAASIVAYRGVAGATRLYDPSSWASFLHPRVDRIICVSEFVRRDLLDQRWLGLRVPPHKAVTIYKGHDVAWYSGEPVDRATFGIPSDAFTVGCLANLREGKGIEYLVDAARHLPRDGRVHFLLVGRGMDGPRVRRWIDASPDPSVFHVTGLRRDGPEIMAGCDALVLPSVAGEGLSKVVIEAMAYRTPPIVTSTGGGELVVNGTSGLVVPPRDPAAIAAAIIRLSGDPQEARRMGETARVRIDARFSVDETVRLTRLLYEELASTAGGRKRRS